MWGEGESVSRGDQRLNMELDIQSYVGSMSRDVHSCTHWLRSRNSLPPPAFGRVYEGAIGQQRYVDDFSL
jgi:hypothetical protein